MKADWRQKNYANEGVVKILLSLKRRDSYT